TYDCPGGDNNYADYILRQPGAVMTSAPGLGNDPLTQALIANNPGVAPIYPTGENQRQCNRRGLTELGKYAFKRLMEKGIIIEVDHMELSIKGDLIEMADRQQPTGVHPRRTRWHYSGAGPENSGSWRHYLSLPGQCTKLD
ncbi:MAG: hypothetical protein VW447_09745, partial [Limnobacter sp.]